MTEQRNATANVTAWFRGAGYAINDTTSIMNCLYDGDECYSVRVLPTVSAVSADTGYAAGGQELTITGTSLDGDIENVQVYVDDVPCVVQSTDEYEIKCHTGSKVIDQSAVAPDAYIGSQGLKRWIFGNKVYWH